MILLTNDDGILAPGLNALHAIILELDEEVVVVAPSSQKSAIGHGISVDRQIEVEKISLPAGGFGFAVVGTPADCVKLALTNLCDSLPRLVISGINLGPNTGVNVFYSGTVAAALEARILGCQSVAVSIATFIDPCYETAATLTKRLALFLARHPLPNDVILNVNVPNVPPARITGAAITRQGAGKYRDVYKISSHDHGLLKFQLVGEEYDPDRRDDSDDEALSLNKVSITPLGLDLTNYSIMFDEKTSFEKLQHIFTFA